MDKQEQVLQSFELGKYTCSTDGKIWSHANKHGGISKTKRLLTGGLNSAGYRHLNFYSKTGNFCFLWHRMMWIYFNGLIPDTMQINHIDGDKLNNHLNNLELVSQKENIQHAHDNNLVDVAKGERHFLAKFTEDQILDIRSSNKSGYALAKQYGVSKGTIYDILYRRTWKHI